MQLVFENAHYINPEHTAFDVLVMDAEKELLGGMQFPFTYVCDGSDDEGSPVSAAITALLKEDGLTVADYSEPENAAAITAERARAKRNALLKQCDYFVLPDYPASEEDRAAVLAYRDALRNIPDQEGFPQSIAWPEAPECLA